RTSTPLPVRARRSPSAGPSARASAASSAPTAWTSSSTSACTTWLTDLAWLVGQAGQLVFRRHFAEATVGRGGNGCAPWPRRSVVVSTLLPADSIATGGHRVGLLRAPRVRFVGTSTRIEALDSVCGVPDR